MAGLGTVGEQRDGVTVAQAEQTPPIDSDQLVPGLQEEQALCRVKCHRIKFDVYFGSAREFDIVLVSHKLQEMRLKRRSELKIIA